MPKLCTKILLKTQPLKYIKCETNLLLTQFQHELSFFSKYCTKKYLFCGPKYSFYSP